MRGTNSNITGSHWFEWRGAECDLVDHVGVFIVKGQVVAHNPQEKKNENQLREDHVGLCILYCPVIVNNVDHLEIATS